MMLALNPETRNLSAGCIAGAQKAAISVVEPLYRPKECGRERGIVLLV